MVTKKTENVHLIIALVLSVVTTYFIGGFVAHFLESILGLKVNFLWYLFLFLIMFGGTLGIIKKQHVLEQQYKKS